MNGWDAICAYDAATLNWILQQRELSRGPTSASAPLQFAVAGWIFNGMIGPPLLSFSPATQQIEVTISLASGSLIEFDATSNTPRSVVTFDAHPGVAHAQITGTLSTASGVVSNGNVLVSLAGAAFTVTSASPTLTTALEAYYAAAPVTLALGRIPNTAPANLQPTSFTIAMQDSTVLVFATTTGTAGTPGALPSNPIPAGSTAAVIVSAAIAFDTLAASLSGFTVTAEGGIAIATARGGSLNIGAISVDQGNGYAISSSGAVSVPYYGMTLVTMPGAPTMTLTVNTTLFTQNWTYGISGMASGASDMSAEIMVTLTAQATGTRVTLAATYDITLDATAVNGDPTLQGFLNTLATPAFLSQTQNALAALLGTAMTTGLDLSALVNVLTPSTLPYQLSGAMFNMDLIANGTSALASIALSPSQQTIAAGGTCTFTVLDNIPMSWSVISGPGSITAAGVYTAPSNASGVAVIEAVISLAENIVLYGLVTITSSAAAGVTPPHVALAAGCSYDFAVPTGATCSILPSLGTLHGSTYTAPSSAPEISITLTAHTPGKPSSHATIQLMRTDTITITPATATVALGATLTLSATSSDAQQSDFIWIVASPADGTIDATELDSASATYTAPATMPASTTVAIYAYYTGSSAAVGKARITLS